MTVHTGRHFLQIPGPTNIPDRVLRAMDMPGLDHRGAEFAELGFAVLGGMQRMFRTKQPVIDRVLGSIGRLWRPAKAG